MILCADSAWKRVSKNKENESFRSASKPGYRLYWQPCEVSIDNTMNKVCLYLLLSQNPLCSIKLWVSLQRILDSSRIPAAQWSLLLQFLWGPATATQCHPTDIHSSCSHSSFLLLEGNWQLILTNQGWNEVFNKNSKRHSIYIILALQSFPNSSINLRKFKHITFLWVLWRHMQPRTEIFCSPLCSFKTLL